MNKLTLVSMAALCLIFSSCAKEELSSESQPVTQLSPRSNSNPIQLSYVAADGTAATVSCTHAGVSYQDVAVALLSVDVAGSGISTYTVSEVELTTTQDYELSITLDDTTKLSSENLTIDLCDPSLCYSNSIGDLSGTALDFIIDDIPVGL